MVLKFCLCSFTGSNEKSGGSVGGRGFVGRGKQQQQRRGFRRRCSSAPVNKEDVICLDTSSDRGTDSSDDCEPDSDEQGSCVIVEEGRAFQATHESNRGVVDNDAQIDAGPSSVGPRGGRTTGCGKHLGLAFTADDSRVESHIDLAFESELRALYDEQMSKRCTSKKLLPLRNQFLLGGRVHRLNERFRISNAVSARGAPEKMYRFVRPFHRFSYTAPKLLTFNSTDKRAGRFVVAYDMEMDKDMNCVLITFAILSTTLEKEYVLDSFRTSGRYHEGERVMWTTDIDEWAAVIMALRDRKTVFLVAHNGAKFDHFWTVRALQRRGCCVFGLEGSGKGKDVSREMLGGFIDSGTILLRDTIRYMMGALAVHGKMLGCPKLDIGDTIQTITTANIMDFLEYGCRDTRIVVELLRYVKVVLGTELERYGLCHSANFIWYRSQAQMAYNMSLCAFKDKPVFVIDRVHSEEFRRAYFGARVDSMIYGMIFRGEIQAIDIRSMYPASLSRPIRGGTIRALPVYEIEDTLPYWKDDPVTHKPWMGFVSLEKHAVDCYDKFYGILPVKLRKGSNVQTVYVSEGKITGWYTDIDIFAAIEDGWTLERVFAVYEWEYWTEDLAQFYLEAYESRKAAAKTDPRNQVEKIKMNSSYGKYGQRLGAFVDLSVEEMQFADDEYINDQLKNINRRPTTSETVAIDCLSRTRIQHLALKRLCVGSVIFYQDTDSVYLEKHIVEELQLKHPELFVNDLSKGLNVTVAAEDHHTDIVVLAKKLYACGHAGDELPPLVHAKGHPVKDLNFEAMEGVLKGTRTHTTRDRLKGMTWAKTPEGRLEIRIGRFEKMTRLVQVTVPAYKYICAECGFYHTSYIDNTLNVWDVYPSVPVPQ